MVQRNLLACLANSMFKILQFKFLPAKALKKRKHIGKITVFYVLTKFPEDSLLIRRLLVVI